MNTAPPDIDIDDVEDAPTTWTEITCAQYEEQLTGLGEDRCVYSGLTDISGLYGEPRIETVWARKSDPEVPVVKGIRHPAADGSGEGPDARPCTHFIAS